MDQELPDAAAHAPGTHLMAALLCVKWRHGHRLESVTPNQKNKKKNKMSDM